MNLRPFCLLLGFVLLGTNPVLAGYTYKEDDTRLVNGVLYDINGDPVTGTYEVFYENNIRKSLMPYVNPNAHLNAATQDTVLRDMPDLYSGYCDCLHTVSYTQATMPHLRSVQYSYWNLHRV